MWVCRFEWSPWDVQKNVWSVVCGAAALNASSSAVRGLCGTQRRHMARSRQHRYETVHLSWALLEVFCSDVCDVSDAGGEQSGSEFSGILVISNIVFTEELLDKHSTQFKALAYDSEQKVTHTNSRLGEARFRSDTKSTLPISIRYLGSFFLISVEFVYLNVCWSWLICVLHTIY